MQKPEIRKKTEKEGNNGMCNSKKKTETRKKNSKQVHEISESLAEVLSPRNPSLFSL